MSAMRSMTETFEAGELRVRRAQEVEQRDAAGGLV